MHVKLDFERMKKKTYQDKIHFTHDRYNALQQKSFKRMNQLIIKIVDFNQLYVSTPLFHC